MTSTSLGQRLRRWLGHPVEYDLAPYRQRLNEIEARESGLAGLSDAQLARAARELRERARASAHDDDDGDAHLVETFALVRESARRALGQRPFEVQMLAGLALQAGKLAELATGEGKTLAAVAPACLHALSGEGAHVLTFNDYLARRDARWMGPVYERLGLSVGHVQESMTADERRRAYACDVTYLTAREAGFDLLRDGLALDPALRVHRPLHFALVDEADSILIDEARVPLVIAGETDECLRGPEQMALVARQLHPGTDLDTDEYQHNISLTEAGLAHAEALLGCASLHAAENLTRFAQLRNALHAQFLLRRDVDYIVRDGKVELVDDFTGRVAERRHWPDGLQAALEAKEGVRLQAEGRILGSITLQHFLRLYPRLAGMTATAEPAAEEFDEFYGLRVVVLPTHRPSRRMDHPDVVFTHRDAKRAALVREILDVHRTGRPILVGTASVRESEQLAEELRRAGATCRILNAKNDAAEAELVAAAGARGALTISTNMAGRGTDIRLGGPDGAQHEEVLALGGLYVIGTNRHASRRIDQQLRGRAGRQGDPGASRFFVSLEDDLVRRYGVENLISARRLHAQQDDPVESAFARAELARAQRIIEGEAYEIRKTLFAYSVPVELQRQTVQGWRAEALEGESPESRLAGSCPGRWKALLQRVGEQALRAIERRLTVLVIDRCWSEYLVEVREMRDDSHLLAFAGRMPLAEFHRQVGQAFLALEARLDEELCAAFESLKITAAGVDWEAAGLRGPAATWTYLVGENPFGAGGYASTTHRPALGLAAAMLGPLVLLPGLSFLWRRRAKRAEHNPGDGTSALESEDVP